MTLEISSNDFQNVTVRLPAACLAVKLTCFARPDIVGSVSEEIWQTLGKFILTRLVCSTLMQDLSLLHVSSCSGTPVCRDSGETVANSESTASDKCRRQSLQIASSGHRC